MDTALQSSVYVSSPEFAGWLVKRGFHVMKQTCSVDLHIINVRCVCLLLVEKTLEEKMGRPAWCRISLYGQGANVRKQHNHDNYQSSSRNMCIKYSPRHSYVKYITIDNVRHCHRQRWLGWKSQRFRHPRECNQCNFSLKTTSLMFFWQINDGHTPVWYLRADSAREKKSWLMRLAHVHAIVRWVGFHPNVVDSIHDFILFSPSLSAGRFRESQSTWSWWNR